MKKPLIIVILLMCLFCAAQADTLRLPDGLVEIEAESFLGDTSLDEVILPEKLERIGDRAFANSSVKRVYLPQSLKELGRDVFSGCAELIGYGAEDTDASRYFDENGLYFDHHKFVFAAIDAERCELTGYIGHRSELIIPDTDPEGRAVTAIAADALRDRAHIVSLGIPQSVTEIGANAFAGCANLTELTIPENVTAIGAGAFTDCAALTQISLPASLTCLEAELFKGCANLAGLTIPEGVTDIGANAFAGCANLAGLTIPENVTAIGAGAFTDCATLTQMVIPDTVTSLGADAFKGCTGLTSVKIPRGATSIESSFFDGCASLTSVEIPDTVTAIGAGAFSGCAELTEVTIPDTVTEIGAGAFKNCAGLSSVDLPPEITVVAESAFSGCSALTGIQIPAGVTEIGDHAFENCESLTSVGFTAPTLVPRGVSYVTYTIERIGDYAFYNCKNLYAFDIPYGVNYIGRSAFEKCSNLTRVNCPNTLTSIGNRAFTGCISLTDITLSDNLETIGEFAFAGCAMTSIKLPSKLKYLDMAAFVRCKKLNNVVIPDSVEYIDLVSFHYCTQLSRIWIPDDTEIIYDYRVPNYTLPYNTVIYSPKRASLKFPYAEAFAKEFGYTFIPSSAPWVNDEPAEPIIKSIEIRNTENAKVFFVYFNPVTSCADPYMTNFNYELWYSNALDGEYHKFTSDISDTGKGPYMIYSASSGAASNVYFKIRILGSNGDGAVYSQFTRAVSAYDPAYNEVKYRALLIGLNDYSQYNEHFKDTEDFHPLEKLDSAENDLTVMNALLTSVNQHYYVRRFIDLSKAEIRARIADYYGEADENDVTLIYFSGHGVTAKDAGASTGAIVLPKGSWASDFVYTLNALHDDLAQIPGKKILILDSCSSGSAMESTAFSGNSPFKTDKFIVMAAAKEYQSAITHTAFGSWDKVGGFTAAIGGAVLCDGAMPADTNGDGKVTVNEIKNKVESTLYLQTPKFWSSNGDYALFSR